MIAKEDRGRATYHGNYRGPETVEILETKDYSGTITTVFHVRSVRHGDDWWTSRGTLTIEHDLLEPGVLDPRD